MSESADKKKPAGKAESPESLRRRREQLDRELIALLNRRAELANEEAARVDGRAPNTEAPGSGAETNTPQPAIIPPVDDGLPTDLESLNAGPLDAETLRNVYRELAGGWRKLRRKTRVAFLGPAFTYSHLAALARFGDAVDQFPVGSISAVFEEVNRGQADFGVVPVENSTDGRIADTLDMFTRLRVRVCGEVPLPIHHSLLGVGSRAGITEVHSKPQALSQCRNWLSRHLPEARLVEVASTVAAAQTARSRPEVAAVAGAHAAAVYGLQVLAENIEDNQSNVTRFFVIGEESAPRTGRDKLSVMFEVPHKPGALADAMNVFKRAKLNLTWIESFPIARPEGGYMFFVELDGHENDTKVRNALKSLEKKTLRLEVLGSYAKAEQAG